MTSNQCHMQCSPSHFVSKINIDEMSSSHELRFTCPFHDGNLILIKQVLSNRPVSHVKNEGSLAGSDRGCGLTLEIIIFDRTAIFVLVPV